MAGSAPKKKKPADVKALLASARLAERSVELCLRGDLVAKMQDLHRQLIDAEKLEEAAGSLDGGQARVLAEQLDAVREEMRAHTVEMTFRALPRRKWTALVAEHPPREDNDVDRVGGLNHDSFFDAAVRACLAEPTFDEADWAALDDVLSDAQWNTLANAAWAVNARDVDVPFSQRASRILQSSETG